MNIFASRSLPIWVCLTGYVTAARADDPRLLIDRVQTAIDQRVPITMEGKLTIVFRGKTSTSNFKCSRADRTDGERDVWSYQGLPTDAVPPFMVALPSPLANPMVPLPGMLQGGAGQAVSQLRSLGKEQIEGVAYDVVEATDPLDQVGQSLFADRPVTARSIVRKLYFGQDGLIHHITGEVSWIEGGAANAGKPAEHAQFTVDVSTYRKAIVFASRPSTQPPIQSLRLRNEGSYSSPPIALSGTGRLLAQGGANGDIHLFDPGTGKEKATLKGHLDHVTALAFSPDGKRLASADSLVVAMWNVETGQPLYTLKDHANVLALLFAPDGKSFLTCENTNALLARDVVTGRVQHSFDQRWWNHLAFSPDGACLAAISGSDMLLWNARTWQPIEIKENNVPMGTPIAFSPDSTRFALGGYPGVLYVFDARTGQRLQAIKDEMGNISTVWFSADGKTVTALDADNRGDISDRKPGVTSWDTTTWKITASLRLKDAVNVDMGGNYPGNTHVFSDRLAQVDDSRQTLRFWSIPLLPQQP